MALTNNILVDNALVKSFLKKNSRRSVRISQDRVIYWLKVFRRLHASERAIRFAMENHNITETDLQEAI